VAVGASKVLAVSADPGPVIRWECFPSTHRQGGHVEASDEPLTLEKVPIRVGDHGCDFRVVPGYVRHLMGMEKTTND
jgi:hypothetical protein